MIIILLIFIIILLVMVARLLKPKKNDFQKAFDGPLYPNAKKFSENDERNALYPDEVVKFGFRYIKRSEAVAEVTKWRRLGMAEDGIRKIIG